MLLRCSLLWLIGVWIVDKRKLNQIEWRTWCVIVVDNHSTDSTPSFLKEFEKKAINRGWTYQILTNKANRGVGRAFNQGIEASKGEKIAIVNNDTWVMPGWDTVMLRWAEKLKSDMVAPYYDETSFDPIQTLVKARKFVKRNQGKYSKDWCSIFMFFDRKVFDQIGLFDESFFVTCEDNDFRERMIQAGLSYYSVAECYIWHHSKGTREKGEFLPGNYEEEAREVFIKKWGFDPRDQENTMNARLKRRWKKIKSRFELF